MPISLHKIDSGLGGGSNVKSGAAEGQGTIEGIFSSQAVKIEFLCRKVGFGYVGIVQNCQFLKNLLGYF